MCCSSFANSLGHILRCKVVLCDFVIDIFIHFVEFSNMNKDDKAMIIGGPIAYILGHSFN